MMLATLILISATALADAPVNPPDPNGPGTPKPVTCVARNGAGESFSATGSDARLTQIKALELCQAKAPDCVAVGCE
jgi:hypothetical protein